MKALVVAALIALSSFASGAAHADDTDECKVFQDEGERAAASGHLIEARAHYLECAQCGSTQCTDLADAVLGETPSIVVSAKDTQGHDITDATVVVDGAPMATEVDGRAIALDPGPHTVEVQQKTVTAKTTIVLEPRVKARPVEVTLRAPDPDAPWRDRGGHTMGPWAVVALGALTIGAGIGLIATAPRLPAGCDKDTHACMPTATETPTSQAFEQRRDQAGVSVGQPKIGAAVIGGGVVILALGLVWHFLEPTHDRVARGNALSF